MKKLILADAPRGAIVRLNDQWGVVCSSEIIDFWWTGRERVPAWTVVEVA